MESRHLALREGVGLLECGASNRAVSHFQRCKYLGTAGVGEAVGHAKGLGRTRRQRNQVEDECSRRNERLRHRRLRIAGRCSANSGNLPDTTSTASQDDDRTVGLAGAAGRTIFDIRTGVTKDRTALKGLQEHVLRVCQ